MDETEPGTIVVTRIRQRTELLNWYWVLVGGERRRLMRGRSTSYTVPAGAHTVEVRNAWIRQKLDVTVAPGETIRVECGTNVSGWRLLVAWLYFLSSDRVLFVRQVSR